jgi:hypothetical protein
MTEHVNVQGVLVQGHSDLDGRPGAFQFEATDKGLFYTCPCGCGAEGYLGFRGQTQPERPSWEWNGNREHPTLQPSIRKLSGCKWHGFLEGGVWKPCSDSGMWGT